MRKLKLLDEKEKKGIWITEIQYISLMKVCKTRNFKMYRKLKEDYEYLFEEKYLED